MGNKFYIIARTAKTTGIGAMMFGFASHILYAVSKGYIPIVDLKHYQNQYFKEGRVFKDNTWEYYLIQPCGYNLDDIKEEDEVYLSNNSLYSDEEFRITPNDIPTNTFLSENNHINDLRQQFRKYLKFNEETSNYIENQYNEIIKNNTNVLGLLVRGTDFLVRKTKNEPIQPQIPEVIKKVKHFMKKHPEINKIYLATEDDFIYKNLKKEFGEMLIDNNQYRYKYDQNNMPNISEIPTGRKDHNYILGKEYLASLYILSKCKYFVGGRCGGTIVSWILADKWDDCYIWDLGTYGKSKILEFLKNILHLTNIIDSNSGIKYKVITILGLKFTFKKKNPRI